MVALVLKLIIAVQCLNLRSFQSILASLPMSKGGLGLRKMSLVSDPAFIGGVELSLPFLSGPDGIFPSLLPILGRPDLGGADRWSGLVMNGSRTGKEFEAAWNRLRKEAEDCGRFLEMDAMGILSVPVEGAGGSSVDGKPSFPGYQKVSTSSQRQECFACQNVLAKR